MTWRLRVKSVSLLLTSVEGRWRWEGHTCANQPAADGGGGRGKCLAAARQLWTVACVDDNRDCVAVSGVSATRW